MSESKLNVDDLRRWGPAETRMFHDIKDAHLIGPWQGMADRAVKVSEYLFSDDQSELAVAYVEHLEVLALHRVHARKDHFQDRRAQTSGRSHRDRMD